MCIFGEDIWRSSKKIREGDGRIRYRLYLCIVWNARAEGFLKKFEVGNKWGGGNKEKDIVRNLKGIWERKGREWEYSENKDSRAGEGIWGEVERNVEDKGGGKWEAEVGIIESIKREFEVEGRAGGVKDIDNKVFIDSNVTGREDSWERRVGGE